MTSSVHNSYKESHGWGYNHSFPVLDQPIKRSCCWNDIFLIYLSLIPQVFYPTALSLAVTQPNGWPDESIKQSISNPSSSVRTFKSRYAGAAKSVLIYYTSGRGLKLMHFFYSLMITKLLKMLPFSPQQGWTWCWQPEWKTAVEPNHW